MSSSTLSEPRLSSAAASTIRPIVGTGAPANQISRRPPAASSSGTSPTASSRRDDVRLLGEILDEIQNTLAPVWPLADYVAVNPFVGLADRDFLTARSELRAVRDVELLMPTSYFHEQISSGAVTVDDLAVALEQCRREYPQWYQAATLDDYFASGPQRRVASANRTAAPSSPGTLELDQPESDERVFRTVSERVDENSDTATGGDWTTAITHEIARHCAAHYDEGQAIWANPWRDLSLYEAWRETVRLDRRFEKLGANGFCQLVASLPANPREAIRQMLEQLGVPEQEWHGVLSAQYHSIPGWTSYVKYRVREAARAGGECEDLTGLLAIRLAYDLGMVASGLVASGLVASGLGTAACLGTTDFTDSTDEDVGGLSLVAFEGPGLGDGVAPSRDVLDRYLFQVAAETAYRRRLWQELSGNAANASEVADVQMVFCIDVRSEVMRRHLERSHPRLETFGFAGFFGLAMEYVGLGQSRGQSQCPVLLKPGIQVAEGVRGADERRQDEVLDARCTVRWRRQVWKGFQSSAASCFSFVESLGLGYLQSLIGDSCRWLRRNDPRHDGLAKAEHDQLGPVLSSCGGHGMSAAQQVQFAETMLTNLGLTRGFARLVVLCGHASETTNNPYRAGLDCGACGGHSGESNARVAAEILNRPNVRESLRERGIEIPESTRFMAAVHVTTTDEIRFCDECAVPESHRADLVALRNSVTRAGEAARAERAARLGADNSAAIVARSRDWSEVRPEWGLAGNAAFIVAPRTRTRHADLGGRTFLHSYDYRYDSDGKVLELIMTAPMVVTNWINLQYYASAVDNRAYGSGNKVLHNVVGQFGVFQGNGGDLMTGLPWQSVHDGQRFQHEPLRLSVVIEAPRAAIDRVLAKHPGVHDLVRNGWLSLLAIEDERLFQYIAASGWTSWSGQSTS